MNPKRSHTELRRGGGYLRELSLSLGKLRTKKRGNGNDQSPAAQTARNDARRIARLERRA